MHEETIILTVFVLFVVAGVTLLLMAMSNRRYMRELAHRERMAMIERGLVPSPEADPAQFEAATGLATTPASADVPKRGQRFRTLGVSMIGLGVGLAFLIGLTGGDPGIGLGIGGAWVALGAASLLNYFLITRER